MKKIFLFCLLYISVAISFAQKQSFDLITYKAPAGWIKKSTANSIQFSKEDATKGSYCIINLTRSVLSIGDSKKNFDAAWETVVKEMVTVSTLPQMQPVATENGWEIQSGIAAFENDGAKGVVTLVTASNFEKMVNIIILTNSDAYEKNITDFLGSVDLKKAALKNTQQASNNNNSANTLIAGTWIKQGSINPAYNDAAATSSAGYSKDEYIFNANGSYIFYSKTFRYSLNKLLLVKENGTYQVSGNNIFINPQRSVIEAWSKKDGTDKWGKLLTTQSRALEKVTYQFTKHYFSGIQLWNLVLQADKITQRDGPFSNNTTFSNAWYYSPVSSNNLAIELPD